jgi:HD-like signal output (HDOD) protein
MELPILPDAAALVLDACRDESSGARRVGDIIQRDPTLAGHVLRLANSAAYGAVQQIVSLPQAVNRLGSQTLSEIVMAIAVKGRVFRVPRYESALEALWRHSTAAGGYAKEIARLKRQNVEGAFLCGLLHDAGRPVILQAVVDIEKDSKTIFDESLIQSLADELHGQVGSALIRSWKLPGWMASALEWHHDPERAGEDRNSALMTALADRLAHWALEAESESELGGETSALAGHLDIYPEDLEGLKSARDRIRSLAETFA